jgi:hypothetical protein
MAVTEGWTERSWGAGTRVGGVPPRPAPRSLKAALSEAGLGDGEREKRADSATSEAPFHATPQSLSEADLHEARSPRLAYFAGEQTPAVKPVAGEQGVVSPPPWLREARRSRLNTLMMNAFGWTITIIVAGSIIGVAGRYLAVPPGVEHMQTARQ